MTRKELIQLIKYTCGEVLMPNSITEEDAESILNDFLNTESTKQEQPLQDRPERYASRELNGMDVIDLVEHWNLSFAEGNILKYLLRDKGEDVQDLEKIKVYADRRIKQLNKDKAMTFEDWYTSLGYTKSYSLKTKKNIYINQGVKYGESALRNIYSEYLKINKS